MTVLYEPKPYGHDPNHSLPDPNRFVFGSLVRCDTCGVTVVRVSTGIYTYPVRRVWQRLGWVGLAWARLRGRITKGSAKPADNKKEA